MKTALKEAGIFILMFLLMFSWFALFNWLFSLIHLY